MRALACTLFAALAFAAQADAGTIRVLTTGLGNGRVTAAPGIIALDCGPGVATGCTVTFPANQFPPLFAVLVPTPDSASTFVGWHGDCTGTGQCRVTTSGNWTIRAEFAPNTAITPLTNAQLNPAGIAAYLASNANAHVNDSARFLNALPVEYKQGWILMTRSESLQTGTARFPRVMLPSVDARNVFTLGLSKHDAYPGSHPNAIEYMQWDAAEKNFRFHEIVLDTIPAVVVTRPNGSTYESFPQRLRGVSVDEPRCTRCHSTRNIPNPNPSHQGTTGFPPGVVKAKNKPNWDAYDSWGGAMPFNRDRIYKGSLEAAAFRKLFNPWTYANSAPARQVMEQLHLQPPSVPMADVITRIEGGDFDGRVVFPFDGIPFPLLEPLPAGQVEGSQPSSAFPNYSFNNQPGSGSGTLVERSGPRVTLHEVATPFAEEGRAVQLFDRLAGLDGDLNQTRVGDELANHMFATGSVPMDIRPIALAINEGCLQIDAANNRVATSNLVSSTVSLTFDQNFFRHRNNGLGVNEIAIDSLNRAKDLPRRKADIQRRNLDRVDDPYLLGSSSVVTDLLSEYGAGTTAGSAVTIERLRQEVFRRNIDLGDPDQSIMTGGLYVDRETYGYNNERVALYRFLLEPLGVSVDKWSMSVRGRSRTYTFADVFQRYVAPIRNEIVASLTTRPYTGLVTLNAASCDSLVLATNEVLKSPLPQLDAMPPFTDVQRVFNKSCIECHGGLNYPPFSAFANINLDISEEDDPANGNRLSRSYGRATAYTSSTLNNSILWKRITQGSEDCPSTPPPGTPRPLMPCGGPPLSHADVHTIKRWIEGGRTSSAGDPHLTTMDGTNYDFQSAGEFTLLRDELTELQVRQSPVQADAPLPPDAHSGLSSCPSINTAAAVRVGPHRITYQPDPYGNPSPEGLQLHVDGKLVEKLNSQGYALSEGGRILPTTGGGIQIEYPGGADIVITPGWWDYYQLWYLNVDVRRSRAIFGVLGQIQPRNWLPALPNGSTFGERPVNTSDRYKQLYGKFADAWRVTKSTTLFDYAPGTSTATYTLKGWPLDGAKTCALPAGWAPKVPPQKPLSADVAKEVCGALIDKTRRANCIADVMATGEVGFAKTYLATEQIQRNVTPKAPSLVAPMEDAEGLPDAVDFAWEPATDKDGGKLNYLHCVWPVGDTQTFNQCRPVSSKDTKTYVTGLEPNRAYYWKLVVDDGQGGTVESELRRFRTK